MTDGGPDGVPPELTVGGFDRSGQRWVLAIFGLLGLVLGALLPLLTRWASELPWVPFKGPLELLGSFDEPWLVWARPAVGLVGGAVLALWVIARSPVLSIGQERIQVRRRGQVERVIDRAKVAAVYPVGSKLVIETDTGRKLFEDELEGDRSVVRRAFVDHGYPWEGDRG